MPRFYWVFFFQAEDGIRDLTVTGVQTCALPICGRARALDSTNMWGPLTTSWIARARGNTVEAARWLYEARKLAQIGRAACRERAEAIGGDGRVKKKRVTLEARSKAYVRAIQNRR